MLEGVIPALITPFSEASGDDVPAVDYEAWDELVRWQLSAGVNGLVIYGTTGESATLTRDEKHAIAERTVALVAGAVPVIAGTGSNNTADSIALSKELKEIGVDAGLAVAPYYNKPNQRGLFAHFTALADRGELPLVVYNVPSRTVVEIEVNTLVELASNPNIVAVKQAVDSASKIVELGGKIRDKVSILAGDDPLVYSIMSVGGKGVISASASVIPEKMLAITEAAKNGDMEAALSAQLAVLPYIKVLFAETNPAPAKAALKIMGKIPSDALRLPLVPVSDSTRDMLNKLFK